MSKAGLIALGLLFWLLAGLMIWHGIEVDIGVEGYDGARIANASLMHEQAAIIQLGIGAAIVGAIFLAAGSLKPGVDEADDRARKGLVSSKQICPVCDEAVSARASVCKWCDCNLAAAADAEERGQDVPA